MINKTRTVLFFLVVSFWIFAAGPLLAQEPTSPGPTPYTLLAPVPNVSGEPGAECVDKDGKPCATSATYIPGLIKLAISLAGALAVLRLMYAGIKYMSTDAWGEKNEAKSIINDALWGLGLAVSAWLILYTLNPNLVKFDLSVITPLELSTSAIPGLGGGIAPPGGGGVAYNVVLGALAPDIRPYAGPCQNGATTNCVDLNGLQQQTIDGLKALAQACKGTCGTIIITGGTEGGHTTNSTHNTGSAVDLRANTSLNKIITNSTNTLSACRTYTNSNISGRFLWEPKGSTCGGEVPSSNDHWHVTY